MEDENPEQEDDEKLPVEVDGEKTPSAQTEGTDKEVSRRSSLPSSKEPSSKKVSDVAFRTSGNQSPAQPEESHPVSRRSSLPPSKEPSSKKVSDVALRTSANPSSAQTEASDPVSRRSSLPPSKEPSSKEVSDVAFRSSENPSSPQTEEMDPVSRRSSPPSSKEPSSKKVSDVAFRNSGNAGSAELASGGTSKITKKEGLQDSDSKLKSGVKKSAMGIPSTISGHFPVSLFSKRSPFIHNPPDPEERRPRIPHPRTPREYLINFREDLADFQESHGLPRTRDYSFVSLGLALAQETVRAVYSVFLMFAELFPILAIVSLILRFALDKIIDILETPDPTAKTKKLIIFCLEMIIIVIPLWIFIGTIVVPLVSLVFSVLKRLLRFKGGKKRSPTKPKSKPPAKPVTRPVQKGSPSPPSSQKVEI